MPPSDVPKDMLPLLVALLFPDLNMMPPPSPLEASPPSTITSPACETSSSSPYESPPCMTMSPPSMFSA